MSTPDIHWARPDDLAWIDGLERHLNAIELDQKRVRQELVVAAAGGEPVGYLRLERLWGHVPFVSWVVVNDTHRGRGIGTAMLEWIALELQQLMPEEPYLWSSTEPENVRSQQWHLRIGFEEAGFLAGINPGPSGGKGEIFYRRALRTGIRVTDE
ncbi:MAG: GNAT family N-acetyltransferase [Planctomycetota bacterium]|jgi:N-acetylglutamate synthase-like GNAT family acetyltransferase